MLAHELRDSKTLSMYLSKNRLGQGSAKPEVVRRPRCDGGSGATAMEKTQEQREGTGDW